MILYYFDLVSDLRDDPLVPPVYLGGPGGVDGGLGAPGLARPRGA